MAPVIAALERARRVPPGRRPHRASTTTPDVRRDPRRPRLPAPRPLPRRRLRARTASRPARSSPAFEKVLLEEPARRRRRRRRRELHARLRARRRQARHRRSRTSRRACARSTGACPRRSTASSPTGSPTSCSRTARRRSTTCRAEGIGAGRVHYVGNTMIDSLRRCEKRARATRARGRRSASREREYVLVTLHRPVQRRRPGAPVGDRRRASSSSPRTRPVVFPIHPRTRARLAEDGALGRLEARRRALHRAARLPRLPVAAGRRRRDRHRLRRRPGGGLGARRRAASRSARTPSGRSRSPTAPTSCSATTRPRSPRSGPRRIRRRRARSRCGTATPASGSPTCWSPTTRCCRGVAAWPREA